MKNFLFSLKIILISIFAPIVFSVRDRVADFLERSFTLSIAIPAVALSFYPQGVKYKTKLFQSGTVDDLEKQVNDYISSLNPVLDLVVYHCSKIAEPGNGVSTVLLVLRSGIPT